MYNLSYIMLFGSVALICITAIVWRARNARSRAASLSSPPEPADPDPVKSTADQASGLSVNYHFTRNCNYSCGFCFHTAKARDVLDFEVVKQGLRALHAAGLSKINFSGGEPFLHAKLLGDMVRFCKAELKVPVSIVSNGSLIKESWMKEFARYVDILAVSCDSFVDSTNVSIGRCAQGSERSASREPQFEIAQRVAGWCREYNVVFKMNTVVNAKNWDEDMNEHVRAINPARWKVFQCLELEGENSGPDALRSAAEFLIASDKFEAFVDRHRDRKPVPENNEDMKDSYLILDEKMRFLNCTENKKVPTKSILEVGVEAALLEAGFDRQAFVRRGGVYNYLKQDYLEVPDIEDYAD